MDVSIRHSNGVYVWTIASTPLIRKLHCKIMQIDLPCGIRLPSGRNAPIEKKIEGIGSEHENATRGTASGLSSTDATLIQSTARDTLRHTNCFTYQETLEKIRLDSIWDRLFSALSQTMVGSISERRVDYTQKDTHPSNQDPSTFITGAC